MGTYTNGHDWTYHYGPASRTIATVTNSTSSPITIQSITVTAAYLPAGVVYYKPGGGDRVDCNGSPGNLTLSVNGSSSTLSLSQGYIAGTPPDATYGAGGVPMQFSFSGATVQAGQTANIDASWTCSCIYLARSISGNDSGGGGGGGEGTYTYYFTGSGYFDIATGAMTVTKYDTTKKPPVPIEWQAPAESRSVSGTVYYNSNGGTGFGSRHYSSSGSIGSHTHNTNTCIEYISMSPNNFNFVNPGNPSLEDYVFEGWYDTNRRGSRREYTGGEGLGLTFGSKTFYAHWVSPPIWIMRGGKWHKLIPPDMNRYNVNNVREFLNGTASLTRKVYDFKNKQWVQRKGVMIPPEGS